MLGKSDKHNQLSILDMEKEKLTELESRAKEAVETKGKLYRNLGILSGAAMVILLI
jgi:stage III sporulation protein AB